MFALSNCQFFSFFKKVMVYVMEPREWRRPFLCDCCVNSLLMFARLTFRAKKWIRPCGQSVPVQISDVALTSVLLRHKAWRASLLCQDICALNYQNSRDFMKASKVCCCRRQNAEYLLWFLMWADPDRVGDGLTGRQASLVSPPNPRCFIHTSAPALPVPPTATRARGRPWQEAAA